MKGGIRNMAGIGFQLKELYNQSSFFKQLRAYGYSAITATGPMFLSILIILATREWMFHLSFSSIELNLFMAAVEYAFVFSQLLTGGLVFVISRYVADQAFMEKEENVISSMFGAIAITVVAGFLAAVFFYWNSPLTLLFKLLTYLFFTELSIIWILSMYISALKDYRKIVKGYVVGVIIAGIIVYFLTGPLGIQTASAAFVGMDIGFLVIMMFLTRDIIHYFQINNRQYFHFLTYIEKYPALFLIGVTYYFGLYGHNFAAWMSERSFVVEETFLIAPFYDTPVFYAYLSVLPALILFMVTLETTFYTSYKKYYGRVLNGFPLQDIDSARMEMYRVLKLEIFFLAQVQMIVTFLFLYLGVRFLPFIGLTQDQIDIFMIVVLGGWFLSLMITIFLILLYFDERKASLAITGPYAIGSFLINLVCIYLFNIYGAGLFFAAIIGAVTASWLLVSRLNEIDYTTYCPQPIVYKERVTITERFLRRIGSLE